MREPPNKKIYRYTFFGAKSILFSCTPCAEMLYVEKYLSQSFKNSAVEDARMIACFGIMLLFQVNDRQINVLLNFEKQFKKRTTNDTKEGVALTYNGDSPDQIEKISPTFTYLR